MENIQNLTIDDFRVGDLEQVARIVAESFEDEWRRILRIPRENVADFLVEVQAVESFPFPGYFVARERERVVGVIVIKWHGQERPPLKLKLKEAARYGWMTAFRLWLAYRTGDYNPEQGECYLDELAVEAGARRQGVGTELLRFGRQFAFNRGLQKYTLHVAEDNEVAKEVYRRAGFELIRRERSRIQGWLVGVQEWLYMGQKLSA